MGNNVAVVIHTDELDNIAKSSDFGQRLSDAVIRGDTDVVGFNTQLLRYDHADNTQVVLVGQNAIRRLDVNAYGLGSTSDDAEEILLRLLAKKLGYRVTK
jgi:hypothetical protein